MSDADFTIVLPIAYTDIEKVFLEKSIKSAIRLNPGELIFGVDKGVDSSLFDKLEKICSKENFRNWRMIEVDKDPSWNFHLAHVIWECYSASKYDKILSYDIDSALRSEVMLGYESIGNDNVSVLSFTKKLVTRTIPELIRFISYRSLIRKRSNVFSGVYWVYRPFFFEDIKLEEYKDIANGVDTHLLAKTLKNNAHKVITKKEMGVNCFDIQNEDYPWRQFQDGVWYGANRHALRIERVNNYLKNHDALPLSRKLYYPKSTFINVVRSSIIYQHPYLFKGYRWAIKNADHECVRKASGIDINEWRMFGSKYVAVIQNWSRRGTGFA